MADLTITAANVAPSTGAQKSTGIAGVAITAGQSVYVDSSGLVQLAKADTAVHAAATGIALDNAAAGQPITYQTGGTITIGATVVKAGFYFVSAANGGGICLQADLATGNYPTLLGYAPNTTTLVVSPIAPGITSP